MADKFFDSWDADTLEEAIEILDTLYDEGQDTVYNGIQVNDREYDLMRDKLRELRPDSKIFEEVTASNFKAGAVKHVTHDPPMTSLSKINEPTYDDKLAVFKKWLADMTALLGHEPQVVQSYKLDGVALRLYYKDGKLVAAGLRPRNGVTGEDVTANVKYVAGVKEELPEKRTIAITGELICDISDFDAINARLTKQGKDVRANPRNHAAGAIRQHKDPKKTAEGKLRFVAHSLEGDDHNDEVERAKWCNQVLGIPHVQVRPFREEDLATMEKNVPNLNYEVDGIVLAVRNVDEQEQCGRHGSKANGNPRGKIAWKFEEKPAQTVVRDIEWETGRTGRVTPTLVLDPVRLAGTTVQRATGHNIGFLRRKQITVGTTVNVIKSGKIIPKVVEVVDGHGDPVYPTHCSCFRNHPLMVMAGGDSKDESGNAYTNEELICNHAKCPCQIAGRLLYYLQKIGVKGLGESAVKRLVAAGIVSEPADYYRMTAEQLVKTKEFSRRQAEIAIAGVHMVANASKIDDLAPVIERARQSKKQIPAGLLIGALGMSGVGESTGNALIKYFGDFDKFRAASEATLLSVPDVGDTTAGVIADGLEELSDQIDALLEFVEPQLPKRGVLTGQSFVLSGKLDGGKKVWREQITALGGEVASSVSRDVTYLVAGEGSGSKSDRANKLGVSIIDTDELAKILASADGK